MERKTAVAAATAVSMTLLSATFAVAASVGALGFGSNPHPAAQPVAVTALAAPSTTATPSAGPVRNVAHEGGEHEARESGSAVTATNANQREGSTSHD
ncbi:MAG: hypothetical protein JJE46_12925 [Acidimicrobiia bacterium]|nr:hypothetical protein [Acidimicrobiia bacterium]